MSGPKDETMTTAVHISVREIARIFFRYQKRGIAVFGVSMALVVIALVLCPRKYTSEARLFVRLGRESVTLDPTATAGGSVVSLSSNRESEINSVIEVLRSRSIIERVVDTAIPNAAALNPTDREQEVNSLLKDISIYSPKASSVVILTYKSNSPERAQNTLSQLLDVSLKEHLRVNRTQGSYEFFDQQAGLLKKQLDEASEALRDAKNRHGLVTLDGRRAALEQQLGSVKAQLRESDAALAASQAKTTNLQENVDELPSHLVQQLTGGTPSSALGSMRQKLYELQAAEQELKSKLTPQHPKVISMHRQVQEVEEILRQETPNHAESVTALVANEQANAASLIARIRSLESQRTDLDQELRELNEHDLLVTQLERKVRMFDSNYVHYITGLEQARIDQALKTEGISNINVVQEPTFAPKPSQPKKAITLLAGFAVSMIGAIGTVLLSNQLDHSIQSVDDLERRFELPAFGSISHVSTHNAEYRKTPHTAEAIDRCQELVTS
jgi:uncharacterized protein involved in exopolysaccharide biosynthesis